MHKTKHQITKSQTILSKVLRSKRIFICNLNIIKKISITCDERLDKYYLTKKEVNFKICLTIVLTK